MHSTRSIGRSGRTDVDSTALLLGELAALYAEVDAANAGSSCPSDTECCRFGVTGREPYVTSIEVAAIGRAVRARGGPLAPKRRALPLVTSAERERICPLLDASSRCSVYASRPFGCRTYFCSRATHAAPRDRALERSFARRLTELAARHEPGGDAPRPLTRVLSNRPKSGG
jgi:Fe-S-cluster containining protein